MTEASGEMQYDMMTPTEQHAGEAGDESQELHVATDTDDELKEEQLQDELQQAATDPYEEIKEEEEASTEAKIEETKDEGEPEVSSK